MTDSATDPRRLDDAESEGTLDPDGNGTDTAATDDAQWAGLLRFLQTARGFDFHGYKPSSLARRIRRRMAALRVDDYESYRKYVENHPEEFRELFNTILINVTSFFRDRDAWEVLRVQALHDIVFSKASAGPIRVWSAGCATGEEAYSVAILLAEELGLDQFRERAKIFATDVDLEALETARRAQYGQKQMENVPEDLRERYFEHADGVYSFRKDLRRQVIFGRHDLTSDAPISRVDLLVCRNTLMYFSTETQSRILSRFHFALNEGGYLFLGRAETLMAHGQIFMPVDTKRRLSRKRSRGLSREAYRPMQVINNSSDSAESRGRLREAALEASPVAQMVLDGAGNIVAVNDRTRSLFGLQRSDVGRPFRDLQLSYRPVELRSLIERVEAERHPASVKEIEWRSPTGETRWLDLHVAPLDDDTGATVGMMVTFTDMTGYRRLQRELEQSHLELETAYEELQSTNEELETTNEELQSTVEELETTNEELQSTNEELETMNEELQSTNEELATINDELRQRGDDLNEANAFLHSVLTSLRGGVAVVDRELRVLAWSRQSEELWGLRGEEVTGEHLLNLDIGLPLERLRPALRSCLGGDSQNEQITLEAVNRRGKKIQCHVTCTPLQGANDAVSGAILLMEEVGQDR
jgi:two-component system CheB/CheR fusion protein